MGRPTVFTQEVLQKLEEAFKMDCTNKEACAYAGISESVYYHECQQNPDFLERMERAQQVPFMLAKKVLLTAMSKEDGNLAMKFLKNRQSDRYQEKSEQKVKVEKDAAEDLAEAFMGVDGSNSKEKEKSDVGKDRDLKS